jgi:type IV pilus assembly protein PilB
VLFFEEDSSFTKIKMPKTNDQLAQFLLDSGLVTKTEIEEAQKAVPSKKWAQFLVEKKIISDEQLHKAYAYVNGIPYVDLENVLISKEVLRVIPESIARKNNIVAFQKEDGRLKVAMLDPDNLPVIDFIRKKTEFKIIPCLTSQKSIAKVLNQYQKSLQAEFGEIIEKNSQTALIKNGGSSEDDLKKAAADLPVVKIVNTLIKHAILQLASDIHIEPLEEGMIVRYRIDGILHDTMNLSKEILPFIVARIKVLANLKLDEHRLPQDGRFKMAEENADISFRVSILPVYGGEKVVMRVLDESSKGLTLEQMGMDGKALEAVQVAFRRPNGMILVSGPTGSGKTTTLYTVLDILNSREVNISTVEDPIEYRMPGVNQTQVMAKIGLTFSAGLRSLLRQDPDIIMVGEIRDAETAEIAAHAAMTGHLVLSTIHTNSAAASLPRLIDMGVEPFLVATTLNVVIAQRLVRKICPNCQENYRLDKDQLNSLSQMADLNQLITFLKKDPRSAKEAAKMKNLTSIDFRHGKGCERCNQTGYKGRAGVFEVLEVDDEIAKMISKGQNSLDIETRAREKGMRTMFEDGFLKAILGITTIEEVLRVTRE